MNESKNNKLKTKSKFENLKSNFIFKKIHGFIKIINHLKFQNIIKNQKKIKSKY